MCYPSNSVERLDQPPLPSPPSPLNNACARAARSSNPTRASFLPMGPFDSDFFCEDQFPPPDPLVVRGISLSIKDIPSHHPAPPAPVLGLGPPGPKFLNSKFCVLHKKAQKIGACEAKPYSFSSPSHLCLIYFQAKVECEIFFCYHDK